VGSAVAVPSLVGLAPQGARGGCLRQGKRVAIVYWKRLT